MKVKELADVEGDDCSGLLGDMVERQKEEVEDAELLVSRVLFSPKKKLWDEEEARNELVNSNIFLFYIY